MWPVKPYVTVTGINSGEIGPQGVLRHEDP